MIGYRLATALAVAAMAVPAFAQVKKVDVPGIQNFNQIDAVFACGGATDAAGVASLKKQGFASIISFRCMRLRPEICAGVQTIGSSASVKSGYLTPHIQACMPPMEVPTISRR